MAVDPALEVQVAEARHCSAYRPAAVKQAAMPVAAQPAELKVAGRVDAHSGRVPPEALPQAELRPEGVAVRLADRLAADRRADRRGVHLPDGRDRRGHQVHPDGNHGAHLVAERPAVEPEVVTARLPAAEVPRAREAELQVVVQAASQAAALHRASAVLPSFQPAAASARAKSRQQFGPRFARDRQWSDRREMQPQR